MVKWCGLPHRLLLSACISDFRELDELPQDAVDHMLQSLSLTTSAAAGGRYEYKMEFPVSAVHMMQVTGRDEFLLIVGPRPPQRSRSAS